MRKLDEIHKILIANPLLQRFMFLNRILLAIAFIPTGLVKVLYQRFTSISLESPIGLFFEVFYQNELWYRTVGLAQILAGVLLLIPRTAHLGTFLFIPIIININLITFGVGFKGTTIITFFMLLSNLYLVVWEYPQWKNWFNNSAPIINYKGTFSRWELIFFIIGTAGLMLIFLSTRIKIPALLIYISMITVLISVIGYLYTLYKAIRS